MLDPTNVTRTAPQNGASVAALILTTDAIVAELPKDEKAPLRRVFFTRLSLADDGADMKLAGAVRAQTSMSMDPQEPQ